MKKQRRTQCQQALHQYFGLDGFRPGQEAAVETLLQGRDLLCVLPTGAGKSLCYQLPAVMHGGMVLVVSPLIALMRDQVEHLLRRGISAASLDSLQTPAVMDKCIRAIRNGTVKLVYASPERLATADFRKLCQAHPPWLVVIDEAHCVVRWGEEFRPAYRQIPDFLQLLPHRPVLCAMTATADPALQRGLCRGLTLHHPRRMTLPVVRPNLIYRVQPTLHLDKQLLTLVKAHTEGRIVVFCARRATTERLAHFLTACGQPAAFYHAGMTRTERDDVQAAFTEGRCRIITATTAFGMGIDVPDIRLTVQYDLPKDLTDYAQQSGRAGRDGQDADCVLLFDPVQLAELSRRFRRTRNERKGKLSLAWFKGYLRDVRATDRLLAWCMAGACLPAGLAHVFGQHAAPCGRCANCLRAARNGRVVPIAKTPHPSRMSENDVVRWTLGWMRDGIAREKHVRPGTLASASLLDKAARTFRIPDTASMPDEVRTRLQAALDHLHAVLMGRE